MQTLRYVSTRGIAPAVPYCEAIQAGFAPDGGLYVPEPATYPGFHKSRLDILRRDQPSYIDTMIEWTYPFVDGVDMHTYRRIVADAFAPAQWGEDPAPIRKLSDKVSILELFHGPSGAFKDHAMQPVGKEFAHWLKRSGKSLTILVATSGDTGPAAVEAFRGVSGVRVIVFYPKDGTSTFQAKQMTAHAEGNIFVIAIDGSFDDCQAIVKNLGKRKDMVDSLNLSGVNSINWGRIKYQIGYYAYAWSRVATSPNDEVTFIVPSGNFGNIFAGFEARQMGLPIRLVMATNANKVLVDFFQSGVYAPWEHEIKTMSPSMNITKASNIERLLFYVTGYDPEATRGYMELVERQGSFELAKAHLKRLRECGIFADFANDDDCRLAMREVYENEQYKKYIMDPHTAVAYVVWKRLKHDAHQSVILSTAAPYKFDAAVQSAIGRVGDRPDRFKDLERAPDGSNVIHLSKDPEKTVDFLKSTFAKAA